MNKDKITKMLSELNLQDKLYYISGETSLVLRGIINECKNLELCFLEDFQNNEDDYEMIEDYPIQCVEKIIEDKKNKNDERYIEIIAKINEYINNMKFEISCGAFVINNNKVLMVQHKNGGHWDFPKGHMEEGESFEQTAAREVLEETGIQTKIMSNVQYKITYKPKMNIQKDVIFFEAEAIGGVLKAQASEICNLEWLSFSDALERITYKNSKKAFENFLINIEKR